MRSNFFRLPEDTQHSSTIDSLQSEHKDEVSPFDIIYNAAKDKNEKIITSVVSAACVDDIQKGSEGTPVSKLASEGQHEAVNFLRTKFNASLSWIAYGYALGGHVNAANDLLKLAATHSDRFALWKKMALGYALGGYVNSANDVLKHAATPDDQLALLGNIALGYALGGHVNAANDVLKHAELPTDRLTLLGCIALGYARGGHVNAANDVLKLAETPSDRYALLQLMAGGYAIGGHVNAANDLLELEATFADQIVFLVSMAVGYTIGGHLNAANDLLKLVLTSDGLDSLLKSFVLSKIIADNLNKIAISNERALLKTLATFDPDSQYIIASKLSNYKEALELVPKAIELNTVMKTQKLTFNQAMVWIQQKTDTANTRADNSVVSTKSAAGGGTDIATSDASAININALSARATEKATSEKNDTTSLKLK